LKINFTTFGLAEDKGLRGRP